MNGSAPVCRLGTPARPRDGQECPSYKDFLFVGFGSSHGDDQAGWLVASELRRPMNVAASLPRGGATASRLTIPETSAIAVDSGHRASLAIASPRGSETTTFACRLAKSPSDLLDWLDDVTHLILCDACDDPTQLGTLCQWRWPAERFVRTRSSSSHQLGLPEVLDLAAALHRLPERVELWTIAGANFSPGSEPSVDVRSACERLARQLSEELARA